MEKLDKKKVLAVVLIIALIASLVSIVSLFYNSVDMFLHDVGNNRYDNDGRTESYIRWQEPYAIITLVAFVVAAFGTGAGIASVAVKKASAKKICLILALGVAGAMLILTFASVGVNFANEAYFINEEHKGFEAVKYPYGVYGNSYFALYSGVMAVMLQQFVLSVIIAAALLMVFIMDKKAEKTDSVKAEDINSENKGEEFNG